MNTIGYVFQAWLPLLVWKQTDAPQYQKGFITASVVALLMIINALVLRTLHRRQRRRYVFPITALGLLTSPPQINHSG